VTSATLLRQAHEELARSAARMAEAYLVIAEHHRSEAHRWHMREIVGELAPQRALVTAL
jgi:hypothetical protein